METEKYYGLDLQTTKKDSSIIDCENPSLNTTNTSLLNKASTTSNYKKLNNCPQTFILKDHNDAITDSSLLVIEYGYDTGNGIEIMYEYKLEYDGNKKQVYLGYEDTNKIFTNKLGTIITTQVTTLDSDTAGCSAKAYLIPNDNTGAPIKFSLNKCTADRIITFSYKNTPIFKINQTYDKTKILTIYVCKQNALSISNDTRYAFFNTRSPILIPAEHEPNIWWNQGYQSFVSTYVLMYTEDKNVDVSTPIGTLLSTGKLTHLSGHDYLTQSRYENLKLSNFSNGQIHHFIETGTGVLDKVTVTLDMNIYLYAKTDNNYQYMPGNTINFSNTESSQHLGVYKLIVTL